MIASLEERSDQEKLAQLVIRNDWGVKKAADWARSVKEHTLDQGEDIEQMGPIALLEMEDVTELPHLTPRADITDEQLERITLYALLRNGMDQEMLDYVDEVAGYPYENLWDYVRGLSADQVLALRRRLALRYIAAAHRYALLEPSLRDELGAEAGRELEAGAYGLPELEAGEGG